MNDSPHRIYSNTEAPKKRGFVDIFVIFAVVSAFRYLINTWSNGRIMVRNRGHTIFPCCKFPNPLQ